ncbi:hypothetical protein H6P81_000116 [Aristolochia fimbriata]|uniref:Amine oxidase domain-containing protein n=1 Tax=Aristolochia fimbriata TaxID=158543 RepID=A0AAV7F3M0_ARIFI|nr:hypothetical protein H6P81_000116 [Aristolochia fimbriata]
MGAKKARIVIVGAGMAGLAAANRLCTAARSAEVFEVVVVEGGNRIGGRIHTSEFMGDRIEMGATWIHGIGGSPVYRIARETGALTSTQPWERMDGFPEQPITVAEGGLLLDPSLVDSVSELYLNLMDFAKGKPLLWPADDDDDDGRRRRKELYDIAHEAAAAAPAAEVEDVSVGSFLRRGLDAYWASRRDGGNADFCGKWSRESLEETIFAMHENTERTYTSAGDLLHLSFNAEREYELFPDEEITIAKGYSSVIEALASVLPQGVIRLGRKVKSIEWLPEGTRPRRRSVEDDDDDDGPVKLHFEDGTSMFADHVIVTVSLGVLKAGIGEEAPGGGLFAPQLPYFKIDAISKLGFGVVNKLFLHLADETNEEEEVVRGKVSSSPEFPFLQLVFEHSSKSLKQGKIPWWMRRTVSVCPIYKKSRVLLSWFAGEEALELESLKEDEVRKGVTTTLSSFDATDWLSLRHRHESHHYHNRNEVWNGIEGGSPLKLGDVLKSGWGRDPLFLGSYSYVAVGSSGDDLDSLAEPLPRAPIEGEVPPLQILFAGEATDRTHYSTTHGAYLSGLREANRLLHHYCC